MSGLGETTVLLLFWIAIAAATVVFAVANSVYGVAATLTLGSVLTVVDAMNGRTRE